MLCSLTILFRYTLTERIIHYLEKFLWFIILDPRVNVHSCLTILMPCQILKDSLEIITPKEYASESDEGEK